MIDSTKAIESLNKFAHEQMLARLIFVSLFGAFDAFLGYLLRALYAHRPRLLNGLRSKEVRFGDILDSTRDENVAAVIDREINGLLRKSYAIIFDRIATRFGISTLKKVRIWPEFIEMSQRRHLLVHCDGIVNHDYLRNCKAEGAKDASLGKKGDRLLIEKPYLIRAIEVVTQIGVQLGHVLWRRTGERSIDQADKHLGNLMFELLKQEKWDMTVAFGEFGQVLDSLNYKKPREELSTRIIHLNHAQAAKWSGDTKTAFALLDRLDWTGSAVEFRFVVACLREEWDNAAALLKRLAGSDILPFHGICRWPILREFRQTTQFHTAFEASFGAKFADKFQSEVSERPKQDDSPKEPPAGDQSCP